MKKLMIILTGIIIVFTTVLCSKKDDSGKPVQEPIDEQPLIPLVLKFEEEKKGGCFISTKSTKAQSDTIIISVQDNKLNIFAGLNFICCAPFESVPSVEDDFILITITDTCPDTKCYCRCYCYYTWDFVFTDFDNKTYHYKVVVESPRLSEPYTLQEGEFNPSSL